MSYTTILEGRFIFSRPLTLKEYKELNQLKRPTLESPASGLERKAFQLTGRCCWESDEDGMSLSWDGTENFREYVEWLDYLIQKRFVPWGIQLEGKVAYHGEEHGDQGFLTIENNKVVVTELSESAFVNLNSDVEEMMKIIQAAATTPSLGSTLARNFLLRKSAN